MISNKIIPAHVLRLYTWELLEANVGLEKILMTDPQGNTSLAVPVIPLENEPQIADSTKPYIVYGYAEQNAIRTREIKRGSYSMRIVSPTFGRLGEITNVLIRGFENGDVSAENVNLWSSHTTIGDLIGLRFTDLDVSYVEGGTGPRSEGGPVEGMVNVAYQYITRQQIKVFNGTTWG